ncbi:MAG: phage holin family protein [Chloroflexota bacterium]|nr:phage holin family protein [Chloroflexota bacterium]
MFRLRNFFRFIIRFAVVWFIDTLALLVTTWLLSGMQFLEFEDANPLAEAAAAAFLLGAINFLIRPLFLLLAVPFGMILVFLIGLIVNAGALMLTASLLPTFQIDSWWTAFLGSLVFSAINTILTNLMTVDDDDSFYHSLIERLAKRRMFEDADSDKRGLVMLEIDGLSYHHMQKAIEDGWMPHVREMMEEDGYTLSLVDCGLPSQTSACQSGIMFGDNFDIPAFRWFDKDQNKLMVSSGDAAAINARYAGGEGLMRDGTSINNMMNGDAHKSLLTLADLRSGSPEEKKQRARDIYLLMLDPYFFMRTIILFIGDIILELWQAFKQRVQNVEPRLNRLHKGYPIMRAATTVFMRDISANLTKLDIIRGSPSIYITWPGYDEVAHHSGPWTRDAFGTLKQYDRVIGSIRETIEHKAPRPYELVILSDHGQSFGATFLQRYGFSLKEFIEGQLPHGTQIIDTSGGDDGTPGLTAMAAELENVQEQGIGGGLGQASTRGIQNAIDRSVKMRTEGNEDQVTAANVTVCGSGNLAQVYFDLYPRKIRLSELNQAYPGMVDALVGHEGVGIVVGYEDDDSPVVLGKNGKRNLHSCEVTGEDPLIMYGDADFRAGQVQRVADFPHAGDLFVISTVYPDGTVAAMEELIGNHGGLGGEQTDAFLLHPMELDVPQTSNSADVFAILNRRRGLTGAPARPEKPEKETVDAWSLKTIVKGLGQVQKWIPLALRAITLDRKAYREIVKDNHMTGPAILLGLSGAFMAALIQVESYGWGMVISRMALWPITVLIVYVAARILRGNGNYTTTFRAMGFASTAYVLDLLGFIPVIGPLVRIIVSLLALVALWMGVSEAHELRGWRSLLIPIGAILVFALTIFILGTLSQGFVITIDSLGMDFGLIPRP